MVDGRAGARLEATEGRAALHVLNWWTASCAAPGMAGLQEPAECEGGASITPPTALAQNQEKTDARTDSVEHDGLR
jgi:hypothetical protein